MNATDLLTELRPPLDDSSTDDATIERILLAPPEPAPPRRERRLRPLAAVAAAAVAATAIAAALPGGDRAPVGLERAVAALNEPQALLHYRVTTTHRPSGAVESAEIWQTPDGRRLRTVRGNGLETAYDQGERRAETYAPERDTVIVDTEPSLFDDEPEPFGSIGASVPSNPVAAGDLAALLELAIAGSDPDVRHVGRTTVRGIDVDHIRIERDLEVRGGPGLTREEQRSAAARTVTVVRDVYVRRDNALPVRVVDDLGDFGTPDNTTSISEYTDAQLLTLNAQTERELDLADHPGARRITRSRFDDSRSDAGRG